MNNQPIVRIGAKIMIQFIMLFALYVQFHGDFGPGGGFQAGVIFAASLILYAIIYDVEEARKIVHPWALNIFLGLGIILYAGTGIAGIFLGGNFLDYNVLAHDPVHGQHLGILLVELGVGITVTCAMTIIFFIFARQEH